MAVTSREPGSNNLNTELLWWQSVPAMAPSAAASQGSSSTTWGEEKGNASIQLSIVYCSDVVMFSRKWEEES